MVYLKSVENVITLGKLIGLLFLFCIPLLSILFLKTKRNDLARPVMGTIFLVGERDTIRSVQSRIVDYWRASEASKTLSGLFNRESRIYIYKTYYTGQRVIVIVKARQRGNYAANSPSPRALVRVRGR